MPASSSVGAAQESPDHLETLIVELEFGLEVGAVHEQMQMILVDERGIVLVAPGFRVEVQAENQIGMQSRVYHSRSLADLLGAVEKDLALPAHTLLPHGIVGSGKILRRIFGAGCFQDRAGSASEIIRPEGRHRFVFFPDERDAGAQGLKFGRQHFRHAQSHFPLFDGRSVAQPEPAFLHFGPGASDVAGIERNL